MERTLISAAILALAVGGTGIAAADEPADAGSQSGYKVTGGGQIVADASGGGAGDTVGFNAHRLSDDGAAKGQFQYVPRGESTNASAPGEKFHGVVTCLISGDEAIAAENAEGDEFNEALAPGSARFTDTPCADNPENEDDEPEELLKLGRGNVKIHNNVDGEPTPTEAAAASAALLRAAL